MWLSFIYFLFHNFSFSTANCFVKRYFFSLTGETDRDELRFLEKQRIDQYQVINSRQTVGCCMVYFFEQLFFCSKALSMRN